MYNHELMKLQRVTGSQRHRSNSNSKTLSSRSSSPNLEARRLNSVENTVEGEVSLFAHSPLGGSGGSGGFHVSHLASTPPKKASPTSSSKIAERLQSPRHNSNSHLSRQLSNLLAPLDLSALELPATRGRRGQMEDFEPDLSHAVSMDSLDDLPQSPSLSSKTVTNPPQALVLDSPSKPERGSLAQCPLSPSPSPARSILPLNVISSTMTRATEMALV